MLDENRPLYYINDAVADPFILVKNMDDSLDKISLATKTRVPFFSPSTFLQTAEAEIKFRFTYNFYPDQDRMRFSYHKAERKNQWQYPGIKSADIDMITGNTVQLYNIGAIANVPNLASNSYTSTPGLFWDSWNITKGENPYFLVSHFPHMVDTAYYGFDSTKDQEDIPLEWFQDRLRSVYEEGLPDIPIGNAKTHVTEGCKMEYITRAHSTITWKLQASGELGKFYLIMGADHFIGKKGYPVAKGPYFPKGLFMIEGVEVTQ